MTMLFTAMQVSPERRHYILDCPHTNVAMTKEYTDDSHDAEMLGMMVQAARQHNLREVWTKGAEACMCQPKGWQKVARA